MRLDKFLTEMEIGSRSQVKALLKQKKITLNGSIVTSGDLKIDETQDRICYQGQELIYRKFDYYMMNKPAGVVSATTDSREKTVLDLLASKDRRRDLFPAGRLDKDTEGFLLLTNDGNLAHKLLSPKYHVDKTYLVHLASPITAEQIQQLEMGVDIGEEKKTLPAKVRQPAKLQLLLTIHEGKFHQVKRMLEAVDNRVVYLKRLTFANLTLDEHLAPGEYRQLTQDEVNTLYEA